MTKKTTAAILRALTVSATFALASASTAVADKGHGPEFGEPGKPAQVSRTMTITMRDNTVEPKSIMLRSGETIRFVVKNTGQLSDRF
jgi:uncharacterized cupredoxin-like copper-binding protein